MPVSAATETKLREAMARLLAGEPSAMSCKRREDGGQASHLHASYTDGRRPGLPHRALHTVSGALFPPGTGGRRRRRASGGISWLAVRQP